MSPLQESLLLVPLLQKNTTGITTRGKDFFGFITYKFWIDFHEEIVLEEHEANDGEHVDEDEGEHRCQDDGTTVAGHRPDDVQKCLFSVNHIEQLQWARI